MRRILIPTDFSVASLQLVEYAILNYPDTKLDIRLIAGYRMPAFRWGAFHFNEREQVHKQLNEPFIDAKRRLLKVHSNNIETFSIELFTGHNSVAFQNYLKQKSVDHAVVPKKSTLCCSSKKWFDTTNFIKNTVSDIVEVSVDISQENTNKRFSPINLFNS